MRAARTVSGYLKCHSKLCGSGVKDSHRLAEAGTGIHVRVMLLAYAVLEGPRYAYRRSYLLATRGESEPTHTSGSGAQVKSS